MFKAQRRVDIGTKLENTLTMRAFLNFLLFEPIWYQYFASTFLYCTSWLNFLNIFSICWFNRVYQWLYAFFLFFILFFIIFHVSWSDACDLPYVGYLRFDWLQVPPMVSANLFHEVANRKAKTWSEPFVTIGTPTFLSKTNKMRITRDIRDRKKRKCSENRSSDLYIIWITTGKYRIYKSQKDYMEIYA